MSNQKIRVALIGAGGMANSVHYPSLSSFDDVELVGLCDIDEEKLVATADKFGITSRYTNYRKMLDEVKPAACYVLMPPHHLFDIAMETMDRGHDLFIEKPPAVTAFQADNLARMAERRSRISAVGFQRRYHPMIQRCWREVKSRGDLHQLTVSFFKNQEPQDVHPYYNGAIDIIHCDAIHAVDSLRYYAGLSPVESVSSRVRTLDCWYQSSFSALVSFENGVVGVFLSNWRSGRRIFTFEFHAFNGMSFADIDEEGRVWTDNSTDPVLTITPADASGSTETYIAQGFQAEARAFIDAVKSRKETHNNLRDSVETMKLVDAIVAAENQR